MSESIELREGLPGHWRHNPEGPRWWGVEEICGTGACVVREYEDGEPAFLAPEWEVPSLEAAKEKIALRKRAWASFNPR